MARAAYATARFDALLAARNQLTSLRPRPGATARDCYRIVNHESGDAAEVHLYDEIGFWGVTAGQFVDEIKAITAPRIALHINSPGGDVFDAVAIHSCLRAHPAAVDVYIDGLAASAASFIAQAGDTVSIARNAMMMIHEAAGLCWGNKRDMRKLGDLLDQLDGNIADMYSVRAGGTVEAWLAAMDAETWYTGAEAVAAGLADEVTGADPEPGPGDVMDRTWDLSIFTYAGRDKAPAPTSGERPFANGGPVEPGTVWVEPGPPGLTIPSVRTAPAAALVDRDAVARSLASQAPAEPAPAPTEPPTDVAPAAAEPDGDEGPADDPIGGPGPVPDGEWNALVAQISTPSAVDGALARLREALL